MPSVLIVDDEEAIRRLIRSTLEQAGYHVREAADGKAGLSHYRQSPADLVIMDILMPDQDGLESILTLRREFPEARIVMVTSHGQEKMVIDALKAGAKGYVLKPFDGQKLNEAIEKACKRVVLKDKLRAELTLRESDADAASATNAPAPSDAPSP